ncbi:MAG: hypothetical protein WC683_02320 [bacterium]
MADEEPATSVRSVLDALLTHLRLARDNRIRTHKAKLMEEFGTARKLLKDAYRDYDPQDVPIDMNRVIRDLEIDRDSTLDEDCEQIESEYRVAIAILGEVADKHPDIYQRAVEKASASPRSWRHPARPVQVRRTPVNGMPLSIVMHLTAVEQAKIIRGLMENREGLYLPKLCALTSDKKSPFKKKAVRQFMGFLRGSGHVKVVGTGRAARYVGAASLKQYKKLSQQ